VVGFSRVRLGVHYPSDVLVGELISVATGLGVWALSP
jgi:membrane-associated phospholipid phosphatase